jgi:hypothetical protein
MIAGCSPGRIFALDTVATAKLHRRRHCKNDALLPFDAQFAANGSEHGFSRREKIAAL